MKQIKMSEKQLKKPRITIKTSPPSSQKGWRIKATGITLIEPCEESGIHIECASTIKEVKDVSINMGKDGISMFLPTERSGANVILTKNVKCGVELASSSSSVNMFI
jgi:cell fate regulator YaaT (PSP1 superfamily)